MSTIRHTLRACVAFAGLCGLCISCLGSNTVQTSPGSDACGYVAAPVPRATPPARPTAHPASGVTRWFALREIRLYSAPDGGSEPSPWRHVGLDLDDRNTSTPESQTSTNSCRRAAKSSSCTLVDGPGGIDNNFGTNFVYLLNAINACPKDDGSNEALAAGRQTLLLRVDEATEGDEAFAPGALYQTGAFDGMPRFDGSDVWPVTSAALVDGADLSRPVVTFPEGYVAQGTWVSGPATARFEVPMGWQMGFWSSCGPGSVRFAAPVDAGIVTFRLDDGVGTLAGAMDVTSAMPAAVEELMDDFGLCVSDAWFENIVAVQARGADLVLGAPDLQDPTRDCDAMSIGLGITMAPAAPPTIVVPPTPPPPDPCASSDAGVADADEGG